MFEAVLSCRQAYLGKSIEVLDKVVRLPDDRVAHRDVVTYAGGAVCVVALTANNCVVLVRQYRPSPEMVMLEIPAGRRHGVHERFLTAARRELRERLTLYIAKDLRHGPTEMDSDEFIRPVLMPVTEAIERCRDGRMNDAKTLIGLLWYAAFEGLAGS
jgi:ADP-ribose pyrophosphatase